VWSKQLLNEGDGDDDDDDPEVVVVNAIDSVDLHGRSQYQIVVDNTTAVEEEALVGIVDLEGGGGSGDSAVVAVAVAAVAVADDDSDTLHHHTSNDLQ
jgi:hypothetical protein